jgi:hypothetical protein
MAAADALAIHSEETLGSDGTDIGAKFESHSLNTGSEKEPR